MKQLTSYVRAVGYLNKLFDLLNERFFDGKLTRPTITIQSTLRAYRIKGAAIPCFYGRIFLEAKLPVVLQELWSALLQFAPYSGIGMKTTLGMGGVKLADISTY